MGERRRELAAAQRLVRRQRRVAFVASAFVVVGVSGTWALWPTDSAPHQGGAVTAVRFADPAVLRAALGAPTFPGAASAPIVTSGARSPVPMCSHVLAALPTAVRAQLAGSGALASAAGETLRSGTVQADAWLVGLPGGTAGVAEAYQALPQCNPLQIGSHAGVFLTQSEPANTAPQLHALAAAAQVFDDRAAQVSVLIVPYPHALLLVVAAGGEPAERRAVMVGMTEPTLASMRELETAPL